MKKVLAMLVAASMALSAPCLGADLNYGSYSDSELQYIVDSARTELYQRQQRAENGNLVLCDVDGVQVAITGEGKVGYGGYLRFEVAISNNSGKTITIGTDKGYINGWESYCSLDAYQLEPKKKVKDELVFELEDAGISTIEEVEDLSFKFHVTDSQTYDRIWESPELQLYLDGSTVVNVQEVVLIG